MAKKDSDIPDFEKSIIELEALIENMEQGELSLDESLKHYEKGVRLTRQCQKALDQAQLKIDSLLAETSDEAEQDDD